MTMTRQVDRHLQNRTISIHFAALSQITLNQEVPHRIGNNTLRARRSTTSKGDHGQSGNQQTEERMTWNFHPWNAGSADAWREQDERRRTRAYVA